MKKLMKFVEQLNDEEVLQLHHDLAAGGRDIKRLVEERAEEIRKAEKTCAICGTNIDVRKVEDYALTFGPRDFKKRAWFCGLDCLEYFVLKLCDLTHKRKTLNT